MRMIRPFAVLLPAALLSGPPGALAGEALRFLFPLRAPGIEDPGFYAIGGYIDHDPEPGRVRDFQCGDRAVDGHQGTDFNLAPFPWRKMAADAVEVIAVAAGRIVRKQDGFDDQSCSRDGSEPNLLLIEHDDGSRALYLHFKRGSLTAKTVGQQVQAGERLGLVGSSGSSTLPHLHLEVYDRDGQLIDPYAGACNTLNDRSWWREQPPYAATLNKLATHSAPPQRQPCPRQALTNFSDRFEPGERLYFVAYYRNRSDEDGRHAVLRPDGSVFRRWVGEANGTHLSDSFQFRFVTLPDDAPTGVWRYRVQFQGETAEHLFDVGRVAGEGGEVFSSGFEAP